MANTKNDQRLITARLDRITGLTTTQRTALAQTLNVTLVGAMSDALLAILVNQTLPTLPVNPEQGLPLGLPGATVPTRYVGATLIGAPTVGDFQPGDWIVAVHEGTFYVCITAGSPGVWQTIGNSGTSSGGGSSTPTTAGLPAGLPGVGSSTRYVGSTLTGPPTDGTFRSGDFVVALDGLIWVCTAGGSPGTWQTTTAAALGAELATNKGVAGGYAALDSSAKLPLATLHTSGSATTTTFLRGDGAWVNPPTGGGGGVGAGIPDWYVNVKDYGATGNGTTDDSAAIAAARDAWIASRGGSDGNTVQRPVLYFPPGRYRVVAPDSLLDPGPELIRGGTIQGCGKNVSVVLFQPTATTTPTLTNRNLMTWQDSNNSGGRVRGLRIRQLGFDSNNPTASCCYSYSTLAGPNDDIWFEDCRWTGSWNRAIGLDGDSTANLNSEMRFVGIALGSTTTFADAFLHSGITNPTTNAQQDQFLNYWFTDCKIEYGGGDFLKFDKGGSIVVTGGSFIGAGGDTGSTGRFFVLGGGSHFDGGICKLLVQGVRFEVRGAGWDIIDCSWSKGNVVFKGCTDSAYAYQSFAPAVVAHQYDFSSGHGPMVAYEDCELIGAHKALTPSTVPGFGSFTYARCRFYNKTTPTSALTWSGSAGPHYKFSSCWGIGDVTA